MASKKLFCRICPTRSNQIILIFRRNLNDRWILLNFLKRKENPRWIQTKGLFNKEMTMLKSITFLTNHRNLIKKKKCRKSKKIQNQRKIRSRMKKKLNTPWIIRSIFQNHRGKNLYPDKKYWHHHRMLKPCIFRKVNRQYQSWNGIWQSTKKESRMKKNL